MRMAKSGEFVESQLLQFGGDLSRGEQNPQFDNASTQTSKESAAFVRNQSGRKLNEREIYLRRRAQPAHCLEERSL